MAHQQAAAHVPAGGDPQGGGCSPAADCGGCGGDGGAVGKPAAGDDLRAVFGHFDHNKDGRISQDEMSLSLRQLGIALDPADLASLMHQADADADGFISYGEFVGLYRELTACSGGDGLQAADDSGEGEGEGEGEMREAFDVFDEDGDGLITAKELHSVLKNTGILQGRSMVDCVAMIRRVDSDGDGHVDFQEFKAMMASGM